MAAITPRHFDRYTDRARRVLALAQEAATELRHNSSYVGTEHLLLGLLNEEGGVATQALQECGLMPDAVRLRVMQVIGEGSREPFPPRAFTSNLKEVLERAVHEALQLGDSYIATEHLLLALTCDGGSVGAQLIAEVASLDTVRGKVLAMLRGYEETENPPKVFQVPGHQRLAVEKDKNGARFFYMGESNFVAFTPEEWAGFVKFVKSA